MYKVVQQVIPVSSNPPHVQMLPPTLKDQLQIGWTASRSYQFYSNLSTNASSKRLSTKWMDRHCNSPQHKSLPEYTTNVPNYCLACCYVNRGNTAELSTCAQQVVIKFANSKQIARL